MLLSEFIVMDLPQKKEALLHHGLLIAKRALPGFRVLLFQCPGYYVEAYCHLETQSIARFDAYPHATVLDDYLDGISIDALLP